MAVTRINNNQITDAASGNALVGINANTKLQNYSITSTKLANSLIYGSDLTITGNLTVQGNSTTIDTTITTIEDPTILLASTQTSGTPTVDIGFVGARGNLSNIAFVWNEANSEFSTVFTSTGESNTTIAITGYANLHTNFANIVGNLSLGGNLSLAGNVTSALNVTGNVTGGNLLTGGLISATGNVTGGNVTTGGQVSAIGNITANTGAFFIGNGSQLTGVAATSATRIVNGTSNVDIPTANGNVTVGVGGTNDVVVIASTGEYVTGVVSATGNVTGGNVTTGGLVSATGNVAGGNLTTGGLVSATGNVIGGNVTTGGLVSATGNVNGGNVTTGGLVSATGNVNGGNILTSGLISAGGNITSATNVNTPNVVGVSGLTLSTGGNANINLEPAGTGNIIVNNRYINGLQLTPQQDADAATKYYVDNLVTTAISYHEQVAAATNTTLATATGGTISYTQPNGVSNGVGAFISTTGTFTTIDTANIQTVGTRILVKNEANAVLNGVYTYTNATSITRSTDTDEYGPASANTLSINDYFFVSSGNVNAGSAWIVDAPSGTITFGTSQIEFAQFSQTQVYSANTSAGLSLIGTVFSAKVDNNTTAFDGLGNISVKAGANLTTPNIGAATGTSLSVTGAVTAGTDLSAAGNVVAGNVNATNLTGTTVSVTGNVTSGNVTTGIISATGNLTAGNISTAGNVTATNFIGNISGNIDAGGANTNIQFNDDNILAGSPGFTFDKVGNVVTANGNISGANLISAALVQGVTLSASGNVIGGNVTTGGLVSATGNINGNNVIATTIGKFGNVQMQGGDITSLDGKLTINAAGGDVDFGVSGDTLANVFYVDAGTGTASFGSSTQVTEAIVNFATTTSIKVPTGNIGQRPAVGVTGMLRFNTTSDSLELYDNNSWTPVGVPSFTVIADEQFAGNGVQTVYTLSTAQTTNSCIVSINGVVQVPTIAYSVSGTTLTFTEAPATADLIDVRQITTTTSVTSISNTSGNAEVSVSDTAAVVNVTGDLSVTGSILGGNINSTAITNGTSNVTVVSSGGNVTTSVGGTSNVMVVSSTDVTITGNLTVTGNATLSGNILGDRIQNGTTTIDIQTTGGNANVTVGGTSNVAVFATTGVFVTGVNSVSGNVTGGNILTGGIVSATGNVTGNFFIGNGSALTGIDATSIQSGTSNVRVVSSGGNVATGVGGTSNVVVVATTGAFITGVVSATGNITGGNLLISGAIEDSAQLDIRTTASNANIVLTPNGTGNVNISSNVMPTANATANIGSASLSFNTIFARATSAQYADLAEKYTADAEYAPGTVVSFGGEDEVTLSAVDADRRVAGVISTNPSYIMNGGLTAAHVATVALTGRVPCRVVGTVRKGDLMVSAGDGTARAELNPTVGTVIGKALKNWDGEPGVVGTIEVVVGRF
jgi:hypothetical protein